MAMLMRTGMRSRVSGRSRRGFGRRGIGAGQRRRMVWIDSSFSSNTTAPGNVTEAALASEAELASMGLSKATIGPMYGRLTAFPDPTEASGDQIIGAWGICLKEADAATSTTSFGPFLDGDSSIWMQWRGFSLIKPDAAGNYPQGLSLYGVDENFVTRNPRKVQPDQELVMVMQNSVSSTATLRWQFWVRVALILP